MTDALPCALQTKSGPINFKDWGYIIHIEWRIDPIEGVKVPYVTLIPKEGEKVVKAKERYMLDDQQAALVRAEHEWLMYPKYYEENVEHFLLYSQDVRLPKGLWGQVRMSAAGTIATWSHDWGLDRVIQFEEGTIGVRKVNLRKIKRELMPIMPKKNGPKRQRIKPSNKYCVFRTHDGGPAETLPLQLGLAIEESELYLHNTYWARIPDILGDSEVSDSLMICKFRLHAYYALYSICRAQERKGNTLSTSIGSSVPHIKRMSQL